MQTTVLNADADSSTDVAGTQLAAADSRGEDGTATRGAPRTEASDVAQQINTAAASPELVTVADEPNPGPTPEKLAAEAKKKADEEAAAKEKAEAAAAAAAKKKEEAAKRKEEQTASRSEAPKSAPVTGDDAFARLAKCESGGNAAINTGNGFYGAFQFDARTWRGNGGTGLPHQHSYEEQLRVAKNLQEARGWSPWPSCSKKLGLR